MEMKRIILSFCALFILSANLYAGEICIPAGTKIEGTTLFGTFAPAEAVTSATFSLSIKASQNPVAVGGHEIPLKDCVIMGDVVADVTVNRAFFRANRIVCSNAKEPGGTRIKGYIVDDKDNKLGIQGVPVSSTPVKPGTPAVSSAAQRYVEAPSGAKVTFYTIEGCTINTK
jgi:hypothetical protein